MLALLMCGAGVASAQSVKPSTNLPKHSYEVPYLKPELRELADRILDCKRDSLSKSSQAKANKLLFEMLKPLKDSANDLVALGVYFMDNTDPRDAEGWRQIPVWIAEHLERTSQDRISKKMDLYPKKEEAPDYARVDSVLYTLFTAEAYLYAKKHERAANQYQIVSGVDTTNFVALYMTALAARANQPTWTLEALEKIKRFYPDFYEADRMIADLYYERNTSLDETLTLESARDKAIEYYKAYFSVVPHHIDSVDIRDKNDFFASCNNYIEVLRKRERTKEMLSVIDTFLPMYTDDFASSRIVPRRYRLFVFADKYSKAEKQFREDGLAAGDLGYWDTLEELNKLGQDVEKAMEYITSSEYPDSTYTYNDFYLAGDYLYNRFNYYNNKASYYDYKKDSIQKQESIEARNACYQRALPLLLKAIQCDSTQDGPFFEIYKIFYENKEYESSIAYYDKYYQCVKNYVEKNGYEWKLSYDVDRVQSYFLVGISGTKPFNIQCRDKAEGFIREVLSIDPNEAKSLYYLIVLNQQKEEILQEGDGMYKKNDAAYDACVRLLSAPDESFKAYSQYKDRWLFQASHYLVYHLVFYRDYTTNEDKFQDFKHKSQEEVDLIKKVLGVLRKINQVSDAIWIQRTKDIELLEYVLSQIPSK